MRIGTALDKVMIETIVELEPELKSNDWKITNEYLFKRISQKMSITIDPRKLGKVAVGLGLSSIWIGKERGKQISFEKLTPLKTYVGHVGHVNNLSITTDLHYQQEKKAMLDMLETNIQKAVFTNKTNMKNEICWSQDSLDTQGIPTKPTCPTSDLIECMEPLVDEVEI